MIGPVTQLHVRPWSTAFRIPTDIGTIWCKASGSGPAYEGRLLDALCAWGVHGAIQPLAIDAERALMLTADGGPTLRATRSDGTGDHDLAAWARILDGYAALQRATEPHVEPLIGLGVPDLRPGRLVGVLAGLVDDDAVWARADAADRDAARDARRRLPRLYPLVAAMADDVASSGVAATIQHDDLHGGNILVGPDGDRIFDWGDASIAHPFTTLTTTMNSIEYHAGLDQHGPELRRLRDGYLAAWSDVAPLDSLVATEERTRVLGAISRAATWERAFHGVPDAERGDLAGSTAGWLVEFVERLDRRTAAASA